MIGKNLLFPVLMGLISGISTASAQDATNGEKLFKRCAACHMVGENAKNKMGPQMNGIVNREAGTIEGFKYSKAMLESGLVWDEATLVEFLRNPRTTVKGTKMSFPGLKKDTDLADLIAYLKTFDSN